MYYVLQVAPGTEERTERLIRGQVRNRVYGRCFHPMRHVRKKFRGEWRDFHEKLLPGYVFITSESVRELYQELRQVPVLTKMLGKEGECFAALQEKEEIWLKSLLHLYEWENTGTLVTGKVTVRAEQKTERRNEEENVVAEIGLSQISAEEKGITILSGPLKKMEGTVKKFYLHKRLAAVEIELMGKKMEIYLGIELVKKTGHWQ